MLCTTDTACRCPDLHVSILSTSPAQPPACLCSYAQYDYTCATLKSRCCSSLLMSSWKGCDPKWEEKKARKLTQAFSRLQTNNCTTGANGIKQAAEGGLFEQHGGGERAKIRQAFSFLPPVPVRIIPCLCFELLFSSCISRYFFTCRMCQTRPGSLHPCTKWVCRVRMQDIGSTTLLHSPAL